MQYLVSVIDDGTGLATPTEEAAIDVFNDRLRAEDYWVFAGGLATSVERWPTDGVPPNPGGWLTTTANRKAIDRLRRENKRSSAWG